MNVTLRPEAEADLEEAARWYDARRSGLGHAFLDEVDRTFGLVGENPRIHPRVHGDIRRALTKRFPFGVYYLLEGDSAVVVAVLHASRDPARWMSRTA